MKLASHNSFTYLPVRRWWMKPFAWTARCQRKNIYRQYLEGVQLFDLRVRFDKKRVPIICHGVMEYKIDYNTLQAILIMLNLRKDCYMRVVLETKKPDTYQWDCFINYCEHLVLSYPHIKFFGGNDRSDWYCEHPIYKFKTPMQDLDGKYASATTRFDNDSWLLKIIDDLYPYDYAKRYNHANREKGTSHKWLMLDFVDID